MGYDFSFFGIVKLLFTNPMALVLVILVMLAVYLYFDEAIKSVIAHIFGFLDKLLGPMLSEVGKRLRELFTSWRRIGALALALLLAFGGYTFITNKPARMATAQDNLIESVYKMASSDGCVVTVDPYDDGEDRTFHTRITSTSSGDKQSFSVDLFTPREGAIAFADKENREEKFSLTKADDGNWKISGAKEAFAISVLERSVGQECQVIKEESVKGADSQDTPFDNTPGTFTRIKERVKFWGK